MGSNRSSSMDSSRSTAVSSSERHRRANSRVTWESGSRFSLMALEEKESRDVTKRMYSIRVDYVGRRRGRSSLGQRLHGLEADVSSASSSPLAILPLEGVGVDRKQLSLDQAKRNGRNFDCEPFREKPPSPPPTSLPPPTVQPCSELPTLCWSTGGCCDRCTY